MERFAYRVIPYRVEVKPMSHRQDWESACGHALYVMIEQQEREGFAFYRIENVHAMQPTLRPGTYDQHPVALAIFRSRRP